MIILDTLDIVMPPEPSVDLWALCRSICRDDFNVLLVINRQYCSIAKVKLAIGVVSPVAISIYALVHNHDQLLALIRSPVLVDSLLTKKGTRVPPEQDHYCK